VSIRVHPWLKNFFVIFVTSRPRVCCLPWFLRYLRFLLYEIRVVGSPEKYRANTPFSPVCHQPSLGPHCVSILRCRAQREKGRTVGYFGLSRPWFLDVVPFRSRQSAERFSFRPSNFDPLKCEVRTSLTCNNTIQIRDLLSRSASQINARTSCGSKLLFLHPPPVVGHF